MNKIDELFPPINPSDAIHTTYEKVKRVYDAMRQTLTPPTVKFRKTHPDVKLPTRGSESASGYDLYAFQLTEYGKPSKVIVSPRSTKMVPTGLCVEPPPGYTLMICSRSGLATKSVFVANAPGIIDPDYRGEIYILLYNGGFESYYVQHEDRIAQLLIVPQIGGEIIAVEEFSESKRSVKGFGSTGR